MKCVCPSLPRLKHRGSLEKPAGTPGDDGHVDLTLNSNWQIAGSRRCAFKTRGGAEGRRFNQVGAEVTHQIEFRYDSLTKTMNPSWRFRMNGRVFNFTKVCDVDEGHRVVLVDATEVV